MAWSSIVGQEAVKELLQRAVVTGRISPAYCLWGPEGVGKDALALEFAKLLNCQAPRREGNHIEACDTCSDCRRAARLEHPSIRLLFALPPPKSRSEGSPLLGLSDEHIAALREELRRKAENPYHNITLPNALQIHISAIRDLQRTLAMTPPQQGRRRVIIISEADRMTVEAANACLKTLEEPHNDIVFILTTSRRELLPPTILSRCQQVFCPPLSDAELIAALHQRHGLSEASARLVAAFAQGRYAQALAFVEHDVATLREHMVALLRTALKPQRYRHELLHQIEELFGSQERNRAELLLSLLLLWLRDAFVLAHTRKPELLINADHYETLSRFLQRFPTADLPAMLTAVESAIRLLHRYVNIQLLVLTTLLRCRYAAHVPTTAGDLHAVPTAA
jgi:DNA polymerase-3 subunit delta'